ncbi:spore coat protein [Bacillus aquiflavi]|uniref:Spore coat protein n=1 Tax=Bacillus aquiflavi TaxID=2672567 RepID=A0A6B3W4C9_9BACI|nr:spore coat protein [Bacillus aquiflavi]MBA4536938.1 spore coat protein [Bacillus aquiflavi]NEY82324.1 spore coat protein [Bacillus aquiflavi]UAC47755.1 spore coat protein [Bacillus aquiflavi]
MNQNQQKVQNPETQVPKTPQMNDRDFVNDMLTTEKYMTTSYTMALHEASHQALYQDLLSIFNETQDAQRELYNLMFKKGWYHVDAEAQQKLQQSYQQFQGYSSQFPYGNGQMQ